MGTDYIFATACIRSRESRLLTGEQFRNLAESKNLEDICRTIQDAGYGAESNPLTISNYQEVLRQEEQALFAEIRDLCAESTAYLIFCYPADYHNMKVLLKAEALGVSREELLMENGTVAVTDMIRCVHERSKMQLTEHMGLALSEAVDAHARTKDPQMIDFICDKHCFADILEAAEASGSDFVQGYVRLWIDTLNLKTFMRVRKMAQPWTYFEEVFIPGGDVDLSVFTAGYEEDASHAAERFGAYAIQRAVSEGGEALANAGTFTLLEKLCDDALMAYTREAAYVTFGLEPVVAYLIARQNEIRNIRILMAGKIAGMDSERIREKLREAYE